MAIPTRLVGTLPAETLGEGKKLGETYIFMEV